jgi:hypothetical protein
MQMGRKDQDIWGLTLTTRVFGADNLENEGGFTPAIGE